MARSIWNLDSDEIYTLYNHFCMSHSIAIYLLRACATVRCRCGLYSVDGHEMIKLEINRKITLWL